MRLAYYSSYISGTNAKTMQKLKIMKPMNYYIETGLPYIQRTGVQVRFFWVSSQGFCIPGQENNFLRIAFFSHTYKVSHSLPCLFIFPFVVMALLEWLIVYRNIYILFKETEIIFVSLIFFHNCFLCSYATDILLQYFINPGEFIWYLPSGTEWNICIVCQQVICLLLR